jgi:hypothetical protein
MSHSLANNSVDPRLRGEGWTDERGLQGKDVAGIKAWVHAQKLGETT